MIISNFVAYVKQMWKNKPDTSTPLSADRLLHIEDGIKGNSDAIEAIAAAVVSQIVNDPDKIASMAALYAVNQKIGDVANLPNSAADVVTAITQQNSNLIYCKTVAVQIAAEAGLAYNETVAHGLSPNKVIAYFIGSVAGSSSTSDITFCHMLNRDTIRIISARSQDVTVMVGYIYSK